MNPSALCADCWAHQLTEIDGDGITVGHCTKCSIAVRILHRSGQPMHVVSMWPCDQAEANRMAGAAEREALANAPTGRSN